MYNDHNEKTQNKTVNKFPKFYFSHIKNFESSYHTLSSDKCSEIIDFVLAVKLKEAIDFPRVLLKADILCANHFPYVLQ